MNNNTKKIIFSASYLLTFKNHVQDLNLQHLHKIAPHVFPKFDANKKPTFAWKQNTNTALLDTLNKLSSSNFAALMSKYIILCDENHLDECVQLVLKKVQLESHYASLYAHFCVAMKKHFTTFECLLQDALQQQYKTITVQHCNLMRFVGFLFVEQYVSVKQLEQVALQLLQQELLVPLCHLLESCGSTLEAQHPQLVNAWITQAQQCASKHDAKVRFAVMDLIDLRTKLQWKVKFDKHARVFVEQPHVHKSVQQQQPARKTQQRTSGIANKTMQKSSITMHAKPKQQSALQKPSSKQASKKATSSNNAFALLQNMDNE